MSAVDLSTMQGGYPLANTEACKMMAAGIEKVAEEKSWSQRYVAQLLNYKSSVALSHMALGRAPIPIDRAGDIARLLGLDVAEFTLAVIEQRYPDVDLRRLMAHVMKSNKATGKTSAPASAPSMLVNELESIAGSKLDELPVSIVNVLREAVGDRNAIRRWMAVSEVPIVEHIRKSRPQGLTPAQVSKLKEAIDAL